MKIQIRSLAGERDRSGDSNLPGCVKERSRGRFEFARTEMDEIVPDIRWNLRKLCALQLYAIQICSNARDVIASDGRLRSRKSV